MPAIDNSKVSGRLGEIRGQLDENQRERLQADEEGQYDQSLQTQNAYLNGEANALRKVLEGRFAPDVKDPTAIGSKDKQPKTRNRRA